MSEKNNWETKASNLIKAELKRNGLTYAHLVERLAALGVEEKETNIRNKLRKAKFSAGYFLLCLEAIGSQQIYLGT